MNGYPGLLAARHKALVASSGVGSMGVPTERSTMPPGWPSAVALAVAIVSQGKSGSSAASPLRRGGPSINMAQ